MQVRKEAERHAIFDCARPRALFSAAPARRNAGQRSPPRAAGRKARAGARSQKEGASVVLEWEAASAVQMDGIDPDRDLDEDKRTISGFRYWQRGAVALPPPFAQPCRPPLSLTEYVAALLHPPRRWAMMASLRMAEQP